MCRYVDAVDKLDTRDFDAVLIDGRCGAPSMRCLSAVCMHCPAPSPCTQLQVEAALAQLHCESPPPPGRSLSLRVLLCRFRVACGLKVLPYLTDSSVVMVHDWEQR